MANPTNKFDKYSSYTYHFELHAADNWTELQKLGNTPSNASTDRFNSNGTLLINTRTDAHQVIDDVHIKTITPGAMRGKVPYGITELTMVVKEPGGFSFIEKLRNRTVELRKSNVQNIVFGLRIIFVGRTPDINAQPVIDVMPMIGLKIISASGTFQPEGGLYNLEFFFIGSINDRLGDTGPQANYTLINKPISFNANNVQEALRKLEERLNENYAQIYDKEMLNSGAKKKQYKITFDTNDISGNVSGNSMQHSAPSAGRNFKFDANQTIIEAISEILKSSPTLATKIGGTSAAMRKQLHEGAFMPITTPSVVMQQNTVDVTFAINVYKGDGTKLELDYYFSEAGKNVDVLNYAVSFVNALVLLSTQAHLAGDANSYFTPSTAKDPVFFANTVTDNTVKPQLANIPTQKTDPNLQSGDPAVEPAVSKSARQGYNNVRAADVPSRKAYDAAIADFGTAIDIKQSIMIRGHRDVLLLCISAPNETSVNGVPKQLVSGHGLWIKINIWMPDGKGGKRQFYYRGYYNVTAITNIFSNGQFTQTIEMMMVTSQPVQAVKQDKFKDIREADGSINPTKL